MRRPRCSVALASILAAVGVVVAGPTGPSPVSAAGSAWPRYLDVRARDLAYDPVRDVVYASVGPDDEDPTYAGKLLTIDPDTAEVLAVHDVGQAPDALEISPDGASLFVGHRPGASVSRVDLATFTTRWTTSLGPGTVFDFDTFADDIEVMPGHPTTIAVSRMVLQLSPRHAGVVIIDDGVARPDITSTLTLANEIEFDATGTVLFGSNAETTGRDLLRFAVTPTGLSLTEDSYDLAGFDIEYAAGQLFTGAGRVLDVSTPVSFEVAHQPESHSFTIDPTTQRQYRAYLTADEAYLAAYDLHSHLEVDRWDLPGLRQPPGRMVSTGPGRVAFLESGLGSASSVVVADTDLASFGEYTPLTPQRILDTRDGTGRSGSVRPVSGGETIDVTVTGLAGVPATGVQAVVMNVTAVSPTNAGYVTVYPSGGIRPLISSLNTRPGVTVANLVTMPVGANGAVSAYVSSGRVDLLFDIAGFYSTQEGVDGMRFHPLSPFRIMDTRQGAGGPVTGIAAGTSVTQRVAGTAGVPTSGAAAVALNVTVTEPSSASFVTVWPSDVPRPVVSNLNFRAGDTIANQVIVRLSASGTFDVFNLAGAAHVIVDVVGYYDDVEQADSGRFVPFSPFRAIDTREDSPYPAPGDLWPGDVLYWGFDDEILSAYVLNVTVTDTRGSGYITAYPYTDERSAPPLASTLNYTPGATVPNHAIVRTGPYLGFANEVGYAQLVVDVFGGFI
ncbi:MAG: hypothetical protein U0Q03_15060 [Acidimicrobiales bacterium]